MNQNKYNIKVLTKIKSYPQYLVDELLDIVFPKKCIGCGVFTRAGDFDYVCWQCFSEIKIKTSFGCIGCKRQTNLGLTCLFCKKYNELDQLLITTELSNNLVDSMLKVYKYKFITSISDPLSVVAARFIKKLSVKGFNLFEDNPLVVPVPLHKRRLNWRGFNQSYLLSKSIADKFLVSCDNNILLRFSNSKNQADLASKTDRLANIKDNFKLNNEKPLNSRTIILVDDICTSGATLNECTKVLKLGGAKKVIGLVVARG